MIVRLQALGQKSIISVDVLPLMVGKRQRGVDEGQCVTFNSMAPSSQ